MRVESVVLYVMAALLVAAGVYDLVKSRRDIRHRSEAGKMFSFALVAVLFAWGLSSLSRRTNSVSKVLAASSGADFFLGALL